jgi:hypothetical protein
MEKVNSLSILFWEGLKTDCTQTDQFFAFEIISGRWVHRNLIGDYPDKFGNDFEMDRESGMKQRGDIWEPEADGFPDRITNRWPASRSRIGIPSVEPVQSRNWNLKYEINHWGTQILRFWVFLRFPWYIGHARPTKSFAFWRSTRLTLHLSRQQRCKIIKPWEMQ